MWGHGLFSKHGTERQQREPLASANAARPGRTSASPPLQQATETSALKPYKAGCWASLPLSPPPLSRAPQISTLISSVITTHARALRTNHPWEGRAMPSTSATSVAHPAVEA